MIKYLQGDAILLHPKTLRENCISIPDDDCIYYIKHFYSDLDENDRTRMYAAVYKKEKPHLEFSVPVKDIIDESISLNISEKDRIAEVESSGEQI